MQQKKTRSKIYSQKAKINLIYIKIRISMKALSVDFLDDKGQIGKISL